MVTEFVPFVDIEDRVLPRSGLVQPFSEVEWLIWQRRRYDAMSKCAALGQASLLSSSLVNADFTQL